MEHEIRYTPQPIADQIMVECLCGWRKTASTWLDDAWREARRLAADHINRNVSEDD